MDLKGRKPRIVASVTAFGAAALFALAPMRVLAASPAASPDATVRKVVESLRKLHTTTNPELRAKETASIDGALALKPLCRQALGAQWSKLSEAERARFVVLIVKLMHKYAYQRAAEFFSALTVEYRGERHGEGGRVVETTVTRAGGGAVSIDYVMERDGKRWKIRDIVLDRQSLAANVAGQVQAVLKQDSYAGLVRQMKARLKQKRS